MKDDVGGCTYQHENVIYHVFAHIAVLNMYSTAKCGVSIVIDRRALTAMICHCPSYLLCVDFIKNELSEVMYM